MIFVGLGNNKELGLEWAFDPISKQAAPCFNVTLGILRVLVAKEIRFLFSNFVVVEQSQAFYRHGS